DYSRRIQDWYVLPQLDFYFRRQYGVSLTRTQSYEFFEGVGFREYNNSVSAYSSRTEQLSLSGSFTGARVRITHRPRASHPSLGTREQPRSGLHSALRGDCALTKRSTSALFARSSARTRLERQCRMSSRTTSLARRSASSSLAPCQSAPSSTT